MFIKTFPVGAFQCNCTILADSVSGEAVVVDPGDEGEKIVAELNRQGLRVKYLVHTHAHIDHILGTRTVQESCGGDICLHRGDQPLYDNLAMQGEFLGLKVTQDALPVTKYLEHGDVIESSSIVLNVLHTPGHTPGSVCFHLPKITVDGKDQSLLFSGDTLFAGSIGRTDLWGGDYDQIIASLKERVTKVPTNTVVIPGHGPQTTILRELKTNPFLVGEVAAR